MSIPLATQIVSIIAASTNGAPTGSGKTRQPRPSTGHTVMYYTGMYPVGRTFKARGGIAGGIAYQVRQDGSIRRVTAVR